MTRLRQSLPNTVRANICKIIILSLFLPSCKPIQPTYKERDIQEAIKNICQKEYDFSVKTFWIGKTIWVYLPLERLLNEKIQWDEETLERINSVSLTVSRVLLSSDKPPDFYCIIASDTAQFGADYTIYGWVPDIVQYQLEFISRDDFLNRIVRKAEINPKALEDEEGKHLKIFDLKLAQFLAEQIAQRIGIKFSEEELEVNESKGTFTDDTFKFEYDISEEKGIDLKREILKIISYVIRNYDFKDFLLVEIQDLRTKDRTVLSREALREIR